MNSKRSSGVVQLAVLIALILFMCGAVLAQDVTYNSAPGIDFSQFKTYKWVKVEGAEYPDQILDTQIKQSIDSQLAAKGFTKTDSDTANLFVAYQVSISQEKQWNAYGGGVGWRMGGGMASATSSTLQVGTLAFDVYDQAGKQLIWKGTATKTLNPPRTQTRNRRISTRR